MIFGAWDRGEHQQRLGLVGIDQHLAVQRDGPDLGVDDSLGPCIRHADFVLPP